MSALKHMHLESGDLYVHVNAKQLVPDMAQLYNMGSGSMHALAVPADNDPYDYTGAVDLTGSVNHDDSSDVSFTVNYDNLTPGTTYRVIVYVERLPQECFDGSVVLTVEVPS